MTSHIIVVRCLLIAIVFLRPLGLAYAAVYDANSTTPRPELIADGAKAATPAKAGLETVVIVYKTHFDIGYTARARDVVHEYRTEMADRVLDAIETNRQQPKDQQFVWTLSGWPMKQIIWEGQTPERRQKLEQAIRDGNLVVHAYPFTTHTETAELEDLVRGLNISSTINRRFGQPLSTSAKMSDVPGQSWIFPTLFTHAGIKFYHMGGPLVNKTLGLPPFFWWEGPDGSRLLTLYNNDYGSSALPPPDWPYKTWIHISMTGDNQGPPAPETVKNDIVFYAQRGIKARVGKMDDFAELILKEDLSNLPVVRSDIPDPWIHGTMSMPGACKQAQNIRPVIGALDELTTLERCWGIFRSDISSTVASAYETSLLFSEHTWGLANQHYIKQPYGKGWDELWARGLPPQYELMAQAWKDHADYIDNIDRLVAAPYDEALATLADNVNVGGGRIVVFNPLPWKRDGEVTLNAFHLDRGSSLKPADGGSAIPCFGEGPAIEGPYRVIRFIARDLPPLGYRTYIVSNDKTGPDGLRTDENAGVIESAFFRATLDAKRGRIASLIDKRSGRELVDADAPQGFGQYFYERFARSNLVAWTEASLYPQYQAHKLIFSAYDMPDESEYGSALPTNMTLTLRQTSIDVSAVMTGEIPGPGQPQQIFIRLTLPATLPVADLEVGWDKKPDGWPETAWISLPFRMEDPKFRVGRLGADLDPIADMAVDYANHHNLWVNNGIAIYDAKTGAGVGVCPRDTPLVSLGEPGEYRFEKRYKPRRPRLFLDLYNNHWRTNFGSWIGDGRRMIARVRLWAFDQFNSESALYSPAMETRVPLAAARTTARPGKLPPTQSGITLSRKGIAVTAFGPNPDGAGTVLRVWEQAGVSGRLTITLPNQFTSATPANLRGEKIGETITITAGEITIDLHAYAPASFILERKPQE